MIFTADPAVFRRSRVMPEQALLAKAVFDNVAESTRELNFRKGDVLQIVDQHPKGLDGWWMCRLDGREGLAAANRLRLLKTNAATADYDIPRPLLSEKTRHSNGATSPTSIYTDTSRPAHVWQADSPPSVRSYRSSGSNYTGSVVFRSPPSSSGSSSGSSRFSIATSDLGSSERNSAEPCGELYDVLPGTAKKLFPRSPEPVKPSQANSSRTAVTSPLRPGSQESVFAGKDIDYDYIDADIVSPTESHYDQLPQRTALPRKMASKDVKKRESFLRCARLYDVLPRHAPRIVASSGGDALVPGMDATSQKSHRTEEDSRSLPIYEPLNITKQAALTRITFMQSQVQTELSRLFSFVSDQTWREHRHLELSLSKMKVCCEYLVNHLKNLIRFLLRAALASAHSASDSTLELKLRSLIDAVYVSCKQIRDELATLDRHVWAPTPSTIHGIETIVATGQILTEDVRKMTAFVLGNAQLIFSEEEELRVQLRPLPGRPEIHVASDMSNTSDTANTNTGISPAAAADDEDHEYEDVDYGHVSAPLQPRSPGTERKILNSYIQEVNEEVGVIRPLIAGFTGRMFADRTVTSMGAIEKSEAIATRTSRLTRLTESLERNLTLQETVELRAKLKKIGGYIATACKRFNSALRAATRAPDEEHFRSVKASLDYLNELCQFLKNSTETEV